MMKADQQQLTVTAYGKCILAGEHAVLRGGPAVVFPVTNRCVTITYWPGNTPLTVVLDAACEPALSLIFSGVLDAACTKLGVSREQLQGRVSLVNQIPLGRGMGFSAAFCVAITKWLIALGYLDSSHLAAFAIRLEDYFHGTSSGVDIVGSLSSQGVWFTGAADNVMPLAPSWKPRLGLLHSGRVSVTAHCIKAVQAFCESDPQAARQVDQDMQRACMMVKQALEQPQGGFEQLAAAIRLAHRCFERWGLVPDEVATQIQRLEAAGAAAVKMTGAGDGGYLLSLWSEYPADIAFDEVLL
jgi:mevalonate kinase